MSLPGSWVPKRKQFCIQGGPKVLQFIHLPSIKIVIPLASGMTNDISWTRNKPPSLFIDIYFPIVALELPIPVAFLAEAKREGGEEEKLVPPFFPSSLSPTSFNACYAGYLLMVAILLSSVPRCRLTFKKIRPVFSFASRSHVSHRKYQLKKQKVEVYWTLLTTW